MGLRILTVIPTFQESENIEPVLRELRRAAPGVDVLVVDDHSPDGTAGLARRVGRELGQIHVLERPAKGGLGSAYRAGFSFALDHGYDVAIEMDADLSHDPVVVPRLVDAIDRGADLALGSRYVAGGATPGWPRRRRLLSRVGNVYARLALGLGIHDVTSGFRAYRAQLLRQIEACASHAAGYGFQIELTLLATRAGARITEVPIVFTDRARGRSKMSARITLEALGLVSAWAVRDRLRRVRRWFLPLGVAPESIAAPQR
jgi:dolichol-phosphate mannosyltransferase